MVAYLERVASEFQKVESVELMAQAVPSGSDEAAETGILSTILQKWQSELLENCGFEVGFGISQLKRYSQEKTDNDLELQKKFGRIQAASHFMMAAAAQEAEMRKVLDLGPYDPKSSAKDRDCVIERRSPRATGTLSQEGPMARELFISYFKETQELLLQKTSRHILAQLVNDHSTWKKEQRNKLLHCTLLKWQLDTFEALGIDRRLGALEIIGADTWHREDEEIVSAKKALLAVSAALQMWSTSLSSAKTRQPSPAGSEKRRIAPHSQLAGMGLDCPSEAAEATLIDDGPIDAARFVAYLEKLNELQEGEWLEAVFQSAAAGDLFAVDRWRNELLEGFGLQHDYANIALQLIGEGANTYTDSAEQAVVEEKLQAAHDKVEESFVKIRASQEAGLRSRMSTTQK